MLASAQSTGRLPCRTHAPCRASPCRRSTCVARATDQQTTVVLSDAYNQQMAKQMNWSEPFQYHFDRGLYFHEVGPNLICGTQPRSPQEIQELANHHRVGTIINLQQDKDIQYWGIDFEANKRACHEHGVQLVRRPARDFDPDSLRTMLPGAVRSVAEALNQGNRVYVHCTAGLGRAPAVCIAYLYWFACGDDLSHLDHAYSTVTSIRPCGPKRDAVRAATYDILRGGDGRHFDSLPPHAFATLSRMDRDCIQRRVRRA